MFKIQNFRTFLGSIPGNVIKHKMLINRFLLFCLLNLCVLFKEIKLTFLL